MDYQDQFFWVFPDEIQNFLAYQILLFVYYLLFSCILIFQFRHLYSLSVYPPLRSLYSLLLRLKRQRRGGGTRISKMEVGDSTSIGDKLIAMHAATATEKRRWLVGELLLGKGSRYKG